MSPSANPGNEIPDRRNHHRIIRPTAPPRCCEYPGEEAGRHRPSHCRDAIEIPPFYAVLIVSTATLLALVHAEGWIWPLKAAACMIPVSLLIG
jgi:hypothetical protein